MVTRDLALLTVVFALVSAWCLVRPPVWAHGEAREGLVVQDIVQHGNWVLPRRNGVLPSKPPLFHWIAAGASSVVGLSDVTLRLPSALAAWAMLAMTFLLGMGLGGRAVGWLAVGALAGTETFWTSASEARTDMLFSACVVASLAGFLVWTRDGRAWARAVCWLAAALAVLAKGPAGAVLPAVVIAGFCAWERRLDRLRAFWSWPLAGAAGLLVVGWYLAAWRVGGDEFLAQQLVNENVHRFVGEGEFAHSRFSRPFLMELTLFSAVLPWSLVIPWALIRRRRGEREDEAGRFLHAWWIGILLFFTVAAGKRAVYLLPLYPAIALLAARALAAAPRERLFGRVGVPGALRRLAPAAPALALLAVCVVAFDVTMLVTNQVLREQRERRKSLLPFVREVAARVPEGALLRAGPGLEVTEMHVLAYRLGRPIERTRAQCAEGGYVVVPAASARGRVVARTQREGDAIALVACPATVADGTLPPS